MVSVPKHTKFALSSGGLGKLRAWLIRHLQTFFYTLGLLARAPLASFLTAAVIGVALALPAGLYVVLDNVRDATRGWDGSTRISLFLKLEIDDGQAREMADRIEKWPDVAEVRVIGRAQALEEFRALSGFADVMEAFSNDNPLPAVLVVEPRGEGGDPAGVEALVERLANLSQVDVAQFDLAWLKRLFAILRIVERGVLVLAALLAAGVLLVVGNTMRLGIENRRQEIEIAKLFGATDAFIRRPFLYSGLLYGAMGGLIAWLLVWVGFLLLGEPVQRLTELYSGDYRLQGLGPWASAGGPCWGCSARGCPSGAIWPPSSPPDGRGQATGRASGGCPRGARGLAQSDLKCLKSLNFDSV
jgi:cell division transport system permease protein